MKQFNILLLTLSLFITMSCSDDNGMDTTTPQILEGNIIPTPVTGVICGTTEPSVIYARSGDSIRIGLTFRDNEGLSQYKVTVQENFDCLNFRNTTSDWGFTKIIDLFGTETSTQEILVVPTDVTAGNYYCSIILLDAAGNTTSPQYYLLSILNNADTIPPSLSLTIPNTNSLTLTNGDTLNLQGTFTDNSNLAGARLQLTYAGLDGIPITATNLTLDSSALMGYNYNIDYIIPNTLSGNYSFELRGYDGVGNISNDQEISVGVQ